MPTERNSKSTSTSPNLNDRRSSLNIQQHQQQQQQRVSSSSSTTYPLGISFLSTSTPLNESEDMAYIEKRTAHNALERQRREGLNSKFQELAHVLPSLQQIRRPSKSMIVAKSLEFVSNAVERETDFKGQLNALRLENAQLLRQASISKKRMRKQIENDSLSNSNSTLSSKKKSSSKQSSTSVNNTAKVISLNKPSASIVKSSSSRKLPSKMKPQLRQSSTISIPNHNPSSSSLITNNISSPPSTADNKNNSGNSTTNTNVTRQNKRSREDDNDNEGHNSSSHSNNTRESAYTSPLTESASVVDTTVIHSPPDIIASNKRRRRTTDNSVSSNMTMSSNNNLDYHSLLINQHLHQQQQQQQQIHTSHHPRHHQRYSSHQSANSVALHDGIISPVVSRHNSITTIDQLPISFNHTNDIDNLHDQPAVVPSQFDIATTSNSPFGNEHTFYSTFENFEHIVSTIPALRTPIGRNGNNNNAASSSISSTPTGTNNNQTPPPYDPLEIFNSLMQDPNSVTHDTSYYWH